MKSDIYQIITDRIIALLEAGTVPWRKPWNGEAFAPRNLVSRKAYRGVNLLLLHAAGFASPFWLTFKQAQELGGSVKKGEKSFPVVFWKLFEDDEHGETRTIPFMRFHSVFNVAQCEGIESPLVPVPRLGFQPIEECERVVLGMPQAPAIGHGFNRACYSPIRNVVEMPDKAAFTPREQYYSVLFHELTHATGHPTRLGRKGVAETNSFGSDPYSREELVAEMGAVFLSGHCGIEAVTIDQSASYIENWLGRLKNDRKLVIKAAADAQKAADFILNVAQEAKAPVEYQPKEFNVSALRKCPVPLEMELCETPQVAGNHSPIRRSPVRLSETKASARLLKIEAEGDRWKGTIKPKIRLIGRWLERAGFDPGKRVEVRCVAPGLIELRSCDQSRMSEPVPIPLPLEKAILPL